MHATRTFCDELLEVRRFDEAAVATRDRAHASTWPSSDSYSATERAIAPLEQRPAAPHSTLLYSYGLRAQTQTMRHTAELTSP